jgi:hypothetical protein
MNPQNSPTLSAYELRRKRDEVVDKFFNKMQRHAMSINAHDEYIVASRGTGKSEGIDARIILRNVWEMPGSLGGLISPSYAKAWGNTLPAICKALAEWGYIQGLYLKLQEYKRKPLTDHVMRMIKEYQRDLDLARRYQPPIKPLPGKTKEYTVFYGEYDVFDNLEVLGEDFIWQMYRNSPPLIWRTAFMNERLFRIENCFYSALDDDIHFYTPGDNGRLRDLGSNWSKLTTCGCLGDGDLNFSKELHLAFDSNASISTAVIGQLDDHTMRVLKSFYVKTPGKLQDLVKMIADYYRPKLNRDVVIYYDHTFTWESGSSTETYADIIERVFKENGYHVTMVYVGQAPKHEWKHLNIDLTLKGDPQFLWIQINLHQNEFLKIAMEQTGVKQGKNGFEKDKTPEGTPDTPDNPDEYKTHITDAFDTLWLGMNFYFTLPGTRAGGIFFLNNK